jgi:hypothetical protein
MTNTTNKHKRHEYNLPLDKRLEKVKGKRNEGYITIAAQMTTIKYRQILRALDLRIEELEDFANDAFDCEIIDKEENEKTGKKYIRELKHLQQAKKELWEGTTWSGNPFK